jgi:hypothetical protein
MNVPNPPQLKLRHVKGQAANAVGTLLEYEKRA